MKVEVANNVSQKQVSASHRSCNPLLLGTNPKASFCRDLFSFRQPKCLQQRMKISGFACKSLNKLIHSLNGNYVCFETHTPTSRSTSWKNSFTLPNGMIVFEYSFYGRDKLWMKHFRRGSTYEIDTDRSSSTRLCGIVLRSVASRGEPLDISPCLWKIMEGRCPKGPSSCPRATTTDLHYGRFTL